MAFEGGDGCASAQIDYSGVSWPPTQRGTLYIRGEIDGRDEAIIDGPNSGQIFQRASKQTIALDV
jgi:hypothetical protein